jgi:GcrA cell cycle regulator
MLQASIASPRAPGNGPGWTDARIERLKALWAEGRSASEIAGLLGEVTRNAVIGKVHRLGLPGRKTTSRQPVPRRTSPRRGKSGRVERHLPPTRFARPASPMPPAPPPPVAALMLPLRQLNDDQCRWPAGDPREDGFGFCGCRKAAGVPYCEHHAAIAYNPAARRGRAA